MPRTVTVDLLLPTDADAITFLDSLVQGAQMTGDKATNVLTLRAWLGELSQRLDVDAPPVGLDDPHLPETPDPVPGNGADPTDIDPPAPGG